jgi:ABC-type transport system involved in cytochrome bd biosynthesis fused ATPase/permease subunit
VSFEIPAGKRIALVAAAGGGKSTLGRILLGDQQPSEGKILFDGIDITDWHVWWKRELIGFLPAEQGFLRGTLEDNVLFGRSKQDVRDYERALSVSGVAAIAQRKQDMGGMQLMIDSKVEDTLSTGERKRVGVARLLAGDQPLFIFDEPDAGLDQHEMGRLARDLVAATAGKTTIIITHNPDVFITDFVVFIANGTVDAIGSHRRLFNENETYRTLVERFAAEREEPATATAIVPPSLPSAHSGKVRISADSIPAD